MVKSHVVQSKIDQLISDVGNQVPIAHSAKRLGISYTAASRIIEHHRKEIGNPYFGRSESLAAKHSALQASGITVGRNKILQYISRQALETLMAECAREGYENIVEAVVDLAIEQLSQQNKL